MCDAKLATLRRLVEAVGGGDANAALAELDSDVEIEEGYIPDAGDIRGHDGFLAWIARWDESFSSWRVEDLVTRSAGDTGAVALFKMIVTGRGSGIELDRNDAVVTTIRDGKVVKLSYYNDHQEALAAAGLE